MEQDGSEIWRQYHEIYMTMRALTTLTDDSQLTDVPT